MITILIEFASEQTIAQAIARAGMGRLDMGEKNLYLTIFPEFSILEKLFSLNEKSPNWENSEIAHLAGN